jgi:hypothetical protein
MARVARYAGHELSIVNAAIRQFAGQVVSNKTLAEWLSSQFPTMLPREGDAHNFLERVALCDFASTMGRDTLRGWAAFVGVRTGEGTTKAKHRSWKIPAREYSALPTKEQAFAALGMAVPAAMATKVRHTRTYRQRLEDAKAGE